MSERPRILENPFSVLESQIRNFQPQGVKKRTLLNRLLPPIGGTSNKVVDYEPGEVVTQTENGDFLVYDENGSECFGVIKCRKLPQKKYHYLNPPRSNR